MIKFTRSIEKFEKKGEKSGWSYITVSQASANKLKPGSRVSFRVKGRIDALDIRQVALIPMGDGSFILPVNAGMRKQLGKKAGDKVTLTLEVDESDFKLSSDFIECLRDDANAYNYFQTLSLSHQRYFSKWIDSAKTTSTKAKRITMAVVALAQGQGFPEMLRANKSSRL